MVTVAPLVAALVSALLLALLDGRRRPVAWTAAALAGGLAALLGWTTFRASTGQVLGVVTGGWPEEVGIHLHADPLGALFATVSVALLAAVLAFEAAHGPRTRSFPALVLFLATGLVGLFLTGDVFDFYVFFELAMVAAFGLSGYGGTPEESRPAAVFVVVNLLGSVIFLAGIAVIYRIAGTLEMGAVAGRVSEAPPGVVLVAASLLLVAFSLKLGLFPFHYWLPVVYRETRPVVAAIFAGALANLASYGLLRFGLLLSGTVDAGRLTLLALGIASILYGGVQAVQRTAMADVLAYSSIGQVGYVVLGLALGGPAAFAAAALYAIFNSVHKSTLFLGAGTAGPWVPGSVLVAGLSVAGLPLTAGFVGKLAVIRAAVQIESAAAVVAAALGGVLSFVYVLQAWQRRYGSDDADAAPASPFASRLVVVALATAVVLIGLWPGPLVAWGERIGAAWPVAGSPSGVDLP